MISMDTLLSLILLAQEQGDGGPFSLLLGPLFPFIVIGVLFYLLLIRPERRKRAEMTQMLDSLKKNDHVVTIGGIYGTVRSEDDKTFTIDIGGGSTMRITKQAVAERIGDDTA